MCTLTWRNDDDLEVFFNRDELKTRGRADPPLEFESKGGTRYLCPIDPDAGGTWMLANEHGLLFCLLNRWHQAFQKSPRKSRGHLPIALADAQNISEIARQLPALCPDCNPFELVVFAGKQVHGFRWSQDQLEEFEPQMPLTSSSFQFERVKTARENSFRNAPSLEQFQSSRNLPSSAYTVRMNRPDAQTWSRSVLKISKPEVTWDYWEEFGDLGEPPRLHQSKLARISNNKIR